MSHESRKAMRKAEQKQESLRKELQLDRYLRVDEDPFPSKRVFKLLKNVDLEGVSFANVQSAGNPMYIEKLNRQELFDLCLVNFARLCVVQEWDGLLSSGGGGGGGVNQLGVLTASGYDTYDVSVAGPFGIVFRDTDGADDEPCFFPFYSPASGDVDAITVGITSAAASPTNFQIGLYNADADTGLPTTKIAQCDIDPTSTGDIRQTSFTGTPTLVKNTLYFAAYCRSAVGVGFFYRSAKNLYSPGAGPTNSTEDAKVALQLQSSNNTLPDTVTAGNLQTTNTENPSLLLEW